MSSRAKVQECIRRARSQSSVEEKLNGIAEAIESFVDYVEQLEHLPRNCDG
jgi:Asp-tRNA(Asn)/Glu-tRNA(Gln) amidotransferase C subunit